jgi:hypothetical protein
MKTIAFKINEFSNSIYLDNYYIFSFFIYFLTEITLITNYIIDELKITEIFTLLEKKIEESSSFNQVKNTFIL